MPEPGNNFAEALQLADSLMSVTTAPGTVVVLSDDTEDILLPEIQQYLQYSDNRILVLPFRPNADLPEAGETDRLDVKSCPTRTWEW